MAKPPITMFSSGKYDTYKGSTLIVATDNKNFFMGKYDTYKGSTLIVTASQVLCLYSHGKYDTYKGSTLARVVVSDFWIC